MNAPKRRSRLAALAGFAGLALVAIACGDDPAPTEPSAVVEIDGDIPAAAPMQVSAADGAAARAERDAVLGRADAPLGSFGAEASDLSVAADQPIPIEPDCGIGGTPYEPSPEDIAVANADTDALAAVLDTYGVSYDRVVDDFGFAYVETDWADVVAQSVVDSFWADRYPPEPIDPAELDRIRSENDRIAAALEAIGVSYTRNSDDSGWEWIEWDYENPDAQAAVEAVFTELYPPTPPSPEQLDSMEAENDRLAAAFDAAGIAYTRMSDDVGWQWIEWDYEDPAASEAAQQVFDELYPPLPGPIGCEGIDPGPIDPVQGEVIAEEPPAVDVGVVDVDVDVDVVPLPVDDAVTSGPADDDRGDIAIEPGFEGSDFTPRQVRRRDAEVAAMEAGFAAAGVEHEVWGYSPWASVTFDIADADAVDVIADILAARA